MNHDYYGDDHDRNLRREGLGDGWGAGSPLGRPPFEVIGPDDDEQWVNPDGSLVPEPAALRDEN